MYKDKKKVNTKEMEETERMKEKLSKKQEGITLVALVVTIVVLLILAGITIMYTMGDNGILRAAQEAKNKTDAAIKNEQEHLDELANIIKNEHGGNNGDNSQGGNTEKPDNPNPDTPTGPTVDDSTSSDHTATTIDYTWEQIDKVAQAIANSSNVTAETTEVTANIDGTICKIGVGDIATVQYKNEAKRVRVLGFKHDDLVYQTVYGGMHEKASISFEFLDFIPEEVGSSKYKRMNSTNINDGGWNASAMRSDLNGNVSSIGGFGANLSNKAYIKRVKKKYLPIYSRESTGISYDYLWLLAASEIWTTGIAEANYGYCMGAEGKQYQYYKGVVTGTGANINLEKKLSVSASSAWWWLRSPSYNSNMQYCNVGSGGNSSRENAGTQCGVAPGFCI